MDMSLSKLWVMVKDKEAWPTVVHGVTKSQTGLSDWTTKHVEISRPSEQMSKIIHNWKQVFLQTLTALLWPWQICFNLVLDLHGNRMGKTSYYLGTAVAYAGLPPWLSGKESTCNAGAIRDTGSIPGSERSPGGKHGNPLQYSYLENPMDRGAWKASVHGVEKSWTRLKRPSMQARM